MSYSMSMPSDRPTKFGRQGQPIHAAKRAFRVAKAVLTRDVTGGRYWI
jgi:hypothetical protein